ncbi:hypothetical protein ACOMHN_021775 [Nucella lapillus]
MVKEQFQETDSAKISQVSFGLMSAEQMRRASHIQVTNVRTYDENRKPLPNGVMDPRLGVNVQQSSCVTCGRAQLECVGHFGFIDLELPCFHIGYFRLTMNVVQMICKTCSAVLVADQQKQGYHETLSRPDMSYIAKKKLRQKIYDECRKVSECPSCGAYNGKLKKVSNHKIVYSYRKKRPDDDQEECRDFATAMATNKDLETILTKYQELWDPVRVRDLLKQINPEDIPLLLMDMENDKTKISPEDLIVTRLLVPPPCIRPTVVDEMKAGSNEDDTTAVFMEINKVNDAIQRLRASGGKTGNIMVLWDLLQTEVYRLVNGEVAVPTQQNRGPMKGFIQRLKGKQGRFRGNLSGKRTDFSARTVISPDPNLDIDQVGVPLHVAKTITYPEKVTPANIELMRELVRNGPDVQPGAEVLEILRTNEKRALRYSDREQLAINLAMGDTVVRQMKDGDIILFNRQPSLHKLSIMAFFAKVMEQKTFRFNICCCNPFNADFDGDEMNLHLPQTEEARAEAITLMASTMNMVTPRNGEPLIAAIQDLITGAHLLTQRDVFFTRGDAAQLVAAFRTGRGENTLVTFPPPALMKPCRMWTGKQVFNMILRPNKSSSVKVNLRAKGKCYSKALSNKTRRLYGKTEPLDLCPDDGYICIQNSELMCGTMDKLTLGSGSKTNVFYIIMRYFGAQHAADAISRLCKLVPYFLTDAGFSIGLEDVTPGPELLKAKKELLVEGKKKCEDFIASFMNGTFPAEPGMTAEESLEASIMKELSNIREKAGQVCLRELPKSNRPLIMAKCGSKGSTINISQMMACVGQQAINGARVPNGFDGRALPHFRRGTKDPASRGFVENSFFSGLEPAEFLFHTMAGREGLVDTAVKTADTGYMQRRLVKNLEDLCVNYDSTVRTSTGEVVQFMFGGDNLNPASMEGTSKPVNFEHLWEHVRNTTGPQFRDEQSLAGPHVESLVEMVLLEEQWAETPLKPGFSVFKNDIREHARKESAKITKARRAFMREDGSSPKVVLQVERYTKSQVLEYLRMCLHKYEQATIEPGEAIGAITAQSVGEPCTQMTLKTFHFAGVASMNVTLGVPRVKEIINASKKIQTPIVRAQLDVADDKDVAMLVKNRVDKTTLEQITKSSHVVTTQNDCFVCFKINEPRIKLLKLEVDLDSIKKSIVQSNLKVLAEDITLYPGVGLTVRPVERKKASSGGRFTEEKLSVFRHIRLQDEVGDVVVKGVKGINRAVIFHDDQNKDQSVTKYIISAEGNNLRGVMNTPGVKGTHTISNNIMEVRETLGIEAARSTIITELNHVMETHGITIDIRHNMLLADFMTWTGEVLGLTRFGLAKMKESVLMLASFEQTADHLFEAAYFGQKDTINGVSESIIMGKPMSVGTGIFQLLQKPIIPPRPTRRPLHFEFPQFHLPGYRELIVDH